MSMDLLNIWLHAIILWTLFGAGGGNCSRVYIFHIYLGGANAILSRALLFPCNTGMLSLLFHIVVVPYTVILTSSGCAVSFCYYVVPQVIVSPFMSCCTTHVIASFVELSLSFVMDSTSIEFCRHKCLKYYFTWQHPRNVNLDLFIESGWSFLNFRDVLFVKSQRIPSLCIHTFLDMLYET